MEEITNPGSTEATPWRGQEAGLPPAACTGAGVGEDLGDVQTATGVAPGDKEDLESGAVKEGGQLAALPASPPRCTSHRRGRSAGGGGGDLLASIQAPVLGHQGVGVGSPRKDDGVWTCLDGTVAVPLMLEGEALPALPLLPWEHLSGCWRLTDPRKEETLAGDC